MMENAVIHIIKLITHKKVREKPQVQNNKNKNLKLSFSINLNDSMNQIFSVKLFLYLTF